MNVAKPSRFKVLITDGRFLSYSTEEKILSEAGADVVLGQCQTEDEVIALGKDADALMVVKASITEKVINNLQKCKVIIRYGVGFDVIDVDAATRQGIMVCNVREYCVEEVAEHALMFMFALSRKAFIAQESIKKNCWNLGVVKPMYRLSSLTLGIVGFGRIGRALAQKAMALGMNIIVNDPYLPVGETSVNGIKNVDLAYVLKNADIISLHVPLSKETQYLIGWEQLSMMKHTAYLVNVGRGGLIDEDALLRALNEKIIAGAGLDFLVKEPTPFDHPLLSLDQVIITPHIAWYSEEAIKDLQREAAEEIARVLKGNKPLCLVNPFVLTCPQGKNE